MKSLVSRFWLPVAVTAIAAVHTVASDPGVNADMRLSGISVPVISERPDTVIYPPDGYKRGWTEEDFRMDANPLEDSLFTDIDSLGTADTLAVLDTIPKLTARDTIPVPDSLRLTDPFRYKYYVALLDSLKDFEYKWWKERPGTFASTPNGDPKAAVRKVLDTI